MESPRDSSAHWHAADRRLSRRSILGLSTAAIFAAAAGVFTARSAYDAHHETASRGRVLFEDVFAGPR